MFKTFRLMNIAHHSIIIIIIIIIITRTSTTTTNNNNDNNKYIYYVHYHCFLFVINIISLIMPIYNMCQGQTCSIILRGVADRV